MKVTATVPVFVGNDVTKDLPANEGGTGVRAAVGTIEVIPPGGRTGTTPVPPGRNEAVASAALTLEVSWGNHDGPSLLPKGNGT